MSELSFFVFIALALALAFTLGIILTSNGTNKPLNQARILPNLTTISGSFNSSRNINRPRMHGINSGAYFGGRETAREDDREWEVRYLGGLRCLRCYWYLNPNLTHLGRRRNNDESPIYDNLTSIHQRPRFCPITSLSRPSVHPHLLALAFALAFTLIDDISGIRDRINQHKMMIPRSPHLPSFSAFPFPFTQTKSLDDRHANPPRKLDRFLPMQLYDIKRHSPYRLSYHLHRRVFEYAHQERSGSSS